MLKTEVNHQVDILIIGAGPTGLGAAKRLHQFNHASWLVLDAFKEPGGLASTDLTPEGFLFDVGGHVIFSHYQYFDDTLLEALPNTSDWFHHERVSFVRSRQTWVPYPYQNNISVLPKSDQLTCLNGLIDATLKSSNNATKKPSNFDEWILLHMGEGIADLFMRPYNFKVWAIPTTLMQCDWLGERVAAPDLKKVIKNVIENRTEGNWGPNATFRYPALGGTGGLWKAVHAKLPKDRFQFDSKVVEIDPIRKQCKTQTGQVYHYQTLISTMPLDLLIHSFTQAIHSTGGPSSSFSTSFTYSSTHVIGLGLRGDPPTHLKEKCWLYFPESNCPFYRVTVFSNYSPHLVPTHRALPTLRKVDPTLPFHSTPSVSPYWSLMFEVSESNYKPVHGATLLEETIQGAFNTDLVTKDMEIVCMYHRRFEHGYPTPTLDRDSILTQWLPNLESMNIFSRGRFGSWKYEVGNQDHSFMLGVEAVDRVLFGIPEYTLLHPNIVNQRQNHERKLVHSSLFTFKPGNGYGIPSKSLDKEDEKVLQKKSHVVRNQEICERS